MGGKLLHVPWFPWLIHDSRSTTKFSVLVILGLASTFIPKCTNVPTSEKIEMWVKCGMVAKAGEEALKAKDMNALELLRGKASGPQLAEIERMINQLKPTK